jgi:hypothetical protein
MKHITSASLCLMFLLCTVLLPESASQAAESPIQAETDGCPSASVQAPGGASLLFWQHHFPDGAWDLALAKDNPGKSNNIRRVTYGGSKADGCQYKALAIARGGDWGWHLAWVNSNGLYYARIDGEAWVSSPPMRMTDQDITAVELQTSGQQVALVWQQKAAPGKRYRAVSEDEGRSWDAAQALP